MNMTKRVAVFVGSLRKESFNRRIAKVLIAFAPSDLKMEILEIRELPLYNQDLDSTPPKEWMALRDSVRSCDALLFVTPEYNRSIPGALKNAIDVGSRPYGHSVWNGKPGAVITCSPGATGGFGANHHLRQVLSGVNVPVMPFPESFVGAIDIKLDSHGDVIDEPTREFLHKFVKAFNDWIWRNSAQ